MLKNFLEHTRCPLNTLSSRSHETLKVKAGGQDESQDRRPTGGSRSLVDAIALLSSLQTPNNTDSLSITGIHSLDEAIGTVRLEQYIDNSISDVSLAGIKAWARKCYYFMRPVLPVSFRKHLQRIALRGWDTKSFPAWPVDVTTEKLVEGIWELLLHSQDSEQMPFIWFWPDGQSSACMMTHDVETRRGRDFCKTIMEMEKCHRITSAFGIIPEGRYPVEDEFLQSIRGNGCEVFVHGLTHAANLFSSEDVFCERATKINSYAQKWGAVGFRSPVMYRNLAWLPVLKLSYDMSVPNVAHLDPQRGGCCTVMPYFIVDMLELPLTTTQDYTLFNILQQRSLGLWKTQVTMIRKKHGLISFIIHPDYVNEPWSIKIYDELLGYLAELRANHGVWIALPKEVDAWWRARREMRLVQQDGAWRVVGPQAEHARVAYASMRDGRVVYSVEKANAVASVQ